MLKVSLYLLSDKPITILSKWEENGRCRDLVSFALSSIPPVIPCNQIISNTLSCIARAPAPRARGPGPYSWLTVILFWPIQFPNSLLNSSLEVARRGGFFDLRGGRVRVRRSEQCQPLQSGRDTRQHSDRALRALAGGSVRVAAGPVAHGSGALEALRAGLAREAPPARRRRTSGLDAAAAARSQRPAAASAAAQPGHAGG